MITSAILSKHDVLRANRRLYDAVGERYEQIDGRRDASLSRWIRSVLSQLATDHGSKVLLDLGTGSGVVIRAGQGLFERSIALDLSPGMLASVHAGKADRVAGDVDFLPFRDGSVDVIACFAVLHHLVDSTRLAQEVSRVLRSGGVFWSDHDIELTFCRRFKTPLAMYRRVRAARQHYANEPGDLDRSTYELAECRESGVDSLETVSDFRRANLDVKAQYHWYGLTPATNRVFGQREFSRGWAPLLRIIAIKPNH